MNKENPPFSEHNLQDYASQVMSDAELLKEGAHYQLDSSGNPVLRVTDEQLEKISSKNQSVPSIEAAPKTEQKKERAFPITAYYKFGKPSGSSDFQGYEIMGNPAEYETSSHAAFTQALSDARSTGASIRKLENGGWEVSAFVVAGSDGAGRQHIGSDNYQTNRNADPGFLLMTAHKRASAGLGNFEPPQALGNNLKHKLTDEEYKRVMEDAVRSAEGISSLSPNEIAVMVACGLQPKIGLSEVEKILNNQDIMSVTELVAFPQRDVRIDYYNRKSTLFITSIDNYRQAREYEQDRPDKNVLFRKKVTEKFGDRPLSLSVLCKAVSSHERRQFIIESLCSSELNKLTPDDAPVLEWLKLVATPEELETARIAVSK